MQKCFHFRSSGDDIRPVNASERATHATVFSYLTLPPRSSSSSSASTLSPLLLPTHTPSPLPLSHLSCPTALSLRSAAIGSARRHWPGPSATKPKALNHPLTHLLSSINTTAIGPIGALGRLPLYCLDPPLLSQVAPTREEERKRDFTFTWVRSCSALPCPALHRSIGLGARPTIWLSEALLRKSWLSRRRV